ncbi:MAG: glutaredoxin [Candidatus Gracilibacteria bacterium]|nr:glutaredoxin [Candidatus Gracilibacteria bacterium]
MKKILISLLFATSLFSLGQTVEPVVAQEAGIIGVEVFVRDDCQHCVDQKEFFEEYTKQYDDIQLNYYNLDDEDNRTLWEKVAELEGLSKVTPITLIGDTVIQGFDRAETTGAMMNSLINQTRGKISTTFQEFVDAGGSGKSEAVLGGGCDDEEGTCAPKEYTPFLINIPFYGTVDAKRYSLPTMSVVLGFIDGFNPCAMWVLVTFLLVLVQIGDRKRMWQIAGLFIFAEAVMYYLILTVWSTVWDFVGLDQIITPIVGIVAIGGGLFFLWEWKQSDGTCNVTNLKQRSNTRSRIKTLAEAEMTIATIIGVLGLALSVNIIEFACSIGIPQAFTKILDLNDLTLLWKHFYIGLYILFYMVDDLIIFGIALYSIEKLGMTTKYSKICNLIGGILMVILGTLLIFFPDALVF